MNSQCELLLTFADELRDAGKLCATIARAKMSEFISRRFIPRAKDDTATVSFIELEERYTRSPLTTSSRVSKHRPKRIAWRPRDTFFLRRLEY
jgi:hypothetical protein